jgi:hypothetical protein
MGPTKLIKKINNVFHHHLPSSFPRPSLREQGKKQKKIELAPAHLHAPLPNFVAQASLVGIGCNVRIDAPILSLSTFGITLALRCGGLKSNSNRLCK